ncbi:DUF721 domain-containing protein [Thiohalophilus sp.]|uniref:DUF721 domain-containing protein n=1 Tax=Thiohalophilus sp. TaxID=3028392 RepID=UPI002ACEFF6D|nr:DUF721 domain-containing protein [Thiohalophilus sp.]MDZ7662322.1 DUF721 domain-containing protein [Thiohalophilus sp.]MDZ7802405.1 DUF721 domain-containing protein [Thiohalophilus sp.]
MNTPRPLYKLLHGEKTRLADLVTTTRQLRRLNQHLLAVLAAPLTDHCQVARYDTEQLIIQVDSPVWASRLRYYVPTLLQELKQNIPDLQGLKSIKIHVAPATPTPVEKPPDKREITPAASRNIQAMAEAIDDPVLREALQRLSRPRRTGDK